MFINRFSVIITWLIIVITLPDSNASVQYEKYSNTKFHSIDIGDLEGESDARNSYSTLLNKISTFSGSLCHGYKGSKGRCLSLESCKLRLRHENYIKYVKDYSCSTKDETVGVCCLDVISKNDSLDINKYNDIGYPVKDESLISRRLKRTPETSDVPKVISNEANTCGRNGNLLSEDLTITTWPWVASVMNAKLMVHYCGATLISRYHALSAAHCFVFEEGDVNKDFVFVRLGEYDFNKTDDTNYVDHKIAQLINHEFYDVFNYQNDISLIVLEEPVKYSIYIQPICLPTLKEDYNNRQATVVGWGHVKRGGPGSEVLKEIQVPIWTYTDCTSRIVQTVFTSNLCAGDEDGNRDSCQADSGGPLMIERNVGIKRRWELAGIVSWGIKCAEKGKPAVYIQVNKYLDWIYDNINGY